MVDIQPNPSSTPPTETFEAIYNMAIDNAIKMVDTVDLFWDDSPREHKDKMISKLEQLKKK